jgi:MYXO-CTERM domain-containing protein
MIESGERICTPRRTSRGRPSGCAVAQGQQGGSALGFLALLALVVLTRRSRAASSRQA